MKNIAVLASGGGSNLQAIIDAIESGDIKNAKIAAVISNNKNAFALERAKKHNIETFVLVVNDNLSLSEKRKNYTRQIINILKSQKIDLVCLAGFMLILDSEIFEPEFYKNKILNIHPSLLPDFGGVGMYGKNVHKAVFESGVKKSGATVHFVINECDKGPIVLQEATDISILKSPNEIATEVLKIEHKIYPEAIKMVLEEKVVF